jgi:putative chitinase
VTGLTAEQLARFAPHCDAEVLAPAIAAAAASFEINTPKRLAHWLGQLSAESMGLTRFVENLNYSAARLCQVWPHRFPDEASAELCVHNPQRLANTVYAGRLGNTHADDGWRFRGRGLIMLTGRANYAHYGPLVGLDLIADPDRAGEPIIAPKLAGAFWAEHHLNPLADADDIHAITRAINGGETGIEDRIAAVAKAKSILAGSVG